MRVLVLTPNFAPVSGGLSRLATDLVRELEASGMDVRVLAVSSRRFRSPHQYHIPLIGRAAWRRAIGRLEMIVCSMVWVAWMRPDAVLAVTWRVAMPAVIVPKAPPILTLALGSEVLRARGPFVWLRRLTFRRSRGVVAISTATERALAGIGVDGSKIVVIPPGVSPGVGPTDGPAPSGRGTNGRRSHTVQVLSVGRLDARKGHFELLEALSDARQTVRDLRLTIVGSGPDEEPIRARIRELALDDVVTLEVGLSDEAVARRYAAADIFALLTKTDGKAFEGFGIVFLEAAQAALPIIAGTSGGASEAVADSMNAFVVENPLEASIALQRLALDRDLRTRMGEEGQRWARRFRWDVIIEQYIEVLVRLTAR